MNLKIKTSLISFLIVLSTIIFPKSAFADGIIIPEPLICETGPCPPWPMPLEQLVIRHHHVTVTIRDQIAVTHVDQVFYNPNDWTVEGTYVFPLPPESAVTAFTLWIEGKPVEGEILDVNQARRKYEEIVRSLQDPALLEYTGRGAVQARIFPIPSKGERRIELEYTQALTAENGLVRYIYPLNTEKFSALPLESVQISVVIQASMPIRATYSPSHNVGVSRDSDTRVRVGYEDQNILPSTDFTLYYSIGESEAFHLLTYRDPADPDGFFMLLLAPPVEQADTPIPKDVLLVLDRSGSMDGEKFQQAQEALRYILKHLNPEDRFNIITFSTGVDTYAHNLRPAAEANEAIPWVDRLRAEGSTDINRALLEAAALVDGERPAYLIFLTDGLPTEGVIDNQEILDNLYGSAPANLRLFAFGVGYDVDTYLLDSLAQAHHGSSTYVLPGERLDETLSAFYARISTPVMTNLSLDFGAIPVYDLYPSPLPDLFRGSQVILVGRYRQGMTAEVILTGEVNGLTQTFNYSEQIFAQETGRDHQETTIPRLWATRKIGHLLNQVRLRGPNQEIIDQIVRLSIRYGIVTPYTSYLVTEPMPLGAVEQERIAAEEYLQLREQPMAPAYGQQAVEKAADQADLAGASIPSAPSAETSNKIHIVGSRTFVYNNGVWVDTTYDPEIMQTVKVAFLSADYFTLLESRKELSAFFALGKQVIVVSDGFVYEIVPADTPVEPLQVPAIDHSPSSELVATPPSTPRNSPVSLPCLGGLLPLVLFSLGFIQFKRRS